jgi:methyl-accepting chemotaxis protein
MPGWSKKQVFNNSVNQLKPEISRKIQNLSSGIFSFFNNFSIRNQIIFFFLMVSLIPITIVGFISYTSSKGAIISKIGKYSQNELSRTIQNLEMKMQGIESVSMQFINNFQYNKTLRDYCNTNEGLEIFEKQQEIRLLLQSVAYNYKDDYVISFLCLQGTIKHMDSGSLPDSFFENKKSKFMKEILAGDGKAFWSLYPVPNVNNYIVMGRAIKDSLSGEILGIIFIFIDEKVLSDTTNGEIDTNADQDNNGSYNMIIDDKGVIISSLMKDDIGKNISDLLDHPDKVRPLLSGQKEKNSFSDKINNQEALATYNIIKDRGWYVLNVAETSYLYKETKELGWTTFIIGIIFAVLAIFISIAIALNISIPLNQVVSAMKRAENGDFTVRANVKRQDELGLLGAGFDDMIEKISNLIQETKEAIDAVLKHSTVLEESSNQSAKTAEAIAAAMEEISQGTMEQTSETEKSSATMSDLAKQIETVFSKAGEVEQISGFARELSVKSNNAVEQLIAKTRETDQITETIIKDILDLNNSADEIREITETITGIAEQTNLLGLNASIEAARAGEMGQGFAVVSEEVNKLAVQSRDAAKTINNILQTIQIKTQNSRKTAEQAHQIIEEQRLAVRSAQEAFTEITTATGNIIARIIFMNNIISNINSNKDHTVRSILNISTVSEQTAASAQEVSASSQEQTALAEQVRMLSKELRKMADDLADTIAKFHIN